MITFLAGKILLKKDKFIILEVAGIGYKVFLSRQTLLKLPEISNDIKLFCFQNVKEDALDLYGFLTYDELDFFEVLMDIRCVGQNQRDQLIQPRTHWSSLVFLGSRQKRHCGMFQLR